MNKKDLIGFRDALTADHDLIYSTWLKGLYFSYNSTSSKKESSPSDSWISNIPQHVFDRNYSKVITKILEKKSVTSTIACLLASPDVALGYAVFDPDTIHWVYVKTSWRGIGLARDMIPTAIRYTSHLTPTGKTICYRKNIIFDPFRI